MQINNNYNSNSRFLPSNHVPHSWKLADKKHHSKAVCGLVCMLLLHCLFNSFLLNLFMCMCINQPYERGQVCNIQNTTLILLVLNLQISTIFLCKRSYMDVAERPLNTDNATILLSGSPNIQVNLLKFNCMVSPLL